MSGHKSKETPERKRARLSIAAASAAFRRRSSGRSEAARRIQRAFRQFRAQFPGGRAHSRSSPAVRYQEDADLRRPLAKAFAAKLKAVAEMDPKERALVLGEAKRREGPEWEARAERMGLVRVVELPGGRMGYLGAPGAYAWAKKGYDRAMALLDVNENLLDDMAIWEIDYVLVKFQLEEAPGVAAAVMGAPTTLLRTRAQRKSLTPKAGHAKERQFVPLDVGDRVVGAPGDRFRMRPDMVRFLDHMLGGFKRYRWQLNPRRRRRVRGRRPVRRYIMRFNQGLPAAAVYRMLRAMYAWKGRVAPSRNWGALFARPVLASAIRKDPRRFRYAVHQLCRRLLRDAGVALAGRSPHRPPPSAGSKLFSYVSTTRSSKGSPKAAHGRPASQVAGYLLDEEHAGLFHARLTPLPDRVEVSLTIFDPHGVMTFADEVASKLRLQVRTSLLALLGPHAAAEVSVAFGPVPDGQGLQYAYEGACGPSSIALVLSLLRAMHASPVADFAESASARLRVFRGVTDEDVVVAAQLVHSAVV
jgi:hypothetical protein